MRDSLVHTKVLLDYGRDPNLVAGVPFKVKVRLLTQMTDSRHVELIWHLPQGLAVSPASKRHVSLHHWPGWAEVEFEITAATVSDSVYRGILEVFAPGRPTVGLIPVVFFGA